MRRATFAQLETFYWIARLGGFHAAAERLKLSQPSISLRIRDLERSLGCPLFYRHGRGVVLSERGEIMLHHVERLMAVADEMEASFNPIGTRSLRFGMPDSVAIACLGRVLRILEDRHPALRLEVSVDSSLNLLRLLRDHKVDLAIVGEPPELAGYLIEYVISNSLGWVAAPQLELPAGVLRPRDLVDLHLLAAPEFSSTHQIMLDWFWADGIKPKRISTCDSLSTIARLTADQIGISILPLSMLNSELSAGTLRLLDIAPALPNRRLFAVASEDPVLTSRWAMTALLSAIRTSVEMVNLRPDIEQSS